MQTPRIAYLLERYVAAQLSEEEGRELAAIMQNPDHELFVQEELVRLLQQEEAGSSEAGMPESGAPEGGVQDTEASDGRVQVSGAPEGGWSAVLDRVLSVDKTATGPVGRVLRLRVRRWMTAASILALAISSGVVYYKTTRPHAVALVGKEQKVTDSIRPGSNRAILTLANGQQIVLDDAHNGVLGEQGKTKVIKLDSGRLAYSGAAADAQGAPLYNTIATPRGGQYQITLPDGTKVWLNAESSIRFPTAFTGDQRVVELNGEAYFEVSSNKNKPFLVKAGGSETRVLGTSFNINAYADEGPVRTTLLDGAVNVGGAGRDVRLQPGEQGVFNAGAITTRVVNTRAVTAWKDGYYFFDRTPVQSVMRQIARWYNVDIVYKGAPPKDEIVGRLPRTAYVSDVLHIMELIGIHFKIEGRTIQVDSDSD
jgi:hypothetical protein